MPNKCLKKTYFSVSYNLQNNYCGLSSFKPTTGGFLNHLPGIGRGLTGPHPKNQTLIPINLKRKFCMSHCYRTIPDAKFGFGIFSIFGDDTQTFPLKKGGTSH